MFQSEKCQQESDRIYCKGGAKQLVRCSRKADHEKGINMQADSQWPDTIKTLQTICLISKTCGVKIIKNAIVFANTQLMIIKWGKLN